MHSESLTLPATRTRSLPRRWDCLLLCALVLLANIPLWAGDAWRWGTFDAALVFGNGQWWRIPAHALVHVSLYQALLDGSAFALLLYSLREEKARWRLGLVGVSLAGALGLSLVWPDGAIWQRGLCGLSGTAHGMMAFWGLEAALRGPTQWERRMGWASASVVLGKSIWEAATGQVFFEWMHMGDVGAPVAVCHLGGVLGGIAVFALRFGRCRG